MDRPEVNKAPVAAGWIVLGLAWLMFLIPFPGLGIIGWALNLAALVLAIVIITRDEMMHGVIVLVCSIVVSPIVWFIGLAVMVAAFGTLESM